MKPVQKFPFVALQTSTLSLKYSVTYWHNWSSISIMTRIFHPSVPESIEYYSCRPAFPQNSKGNIPTMSNHIILLFYVL